MQLSELLRTYCLMKENAMVLERDKLSTSWVGVVVSLNFASCLFFGCAATLILPIIHQLATNWMPPRRAYLLVYWAHDKCGWRMTILAPKCAAKFETSGIEAAHFTYKTCISPVNNYLWFSSLANSSNYHKHFPNKEQQTMMITWPLNWNQEPEYIWYEWIEMNLYTKHSEEKE